MVCLRNRSDAALDLFDFFQACNDALGVTDLLSDCGVFHAVDGSDLVFSVSLRSSKKYKPVVALLAALFRCKNEPLRAPAVKDEHLAPDLAELVGERPLRATLSLQEGVVLVLAGRSTVGCLGRMFRLSLSSIRLGRGVVLAKPAFSLKDNNNK